MPRLLAIAERNQQTLAICVRGGNPRFTHSGCDSEDANVVAPWCYEARLTAAASRPNPFSPEKKDGPQLIASKPRRFAER